MDLVGLSSLSRLSNIHKAALERGKFLTVDDLVLAPTYDIVKNCKIFPSEVVGIVRDVCQELCKQIPLLEQALLHEENALVSTGDAALDDVLGGGILTGMVWELAGESAAGKTQLALQLALSVQLPQPLGGLSGSSCYLTTSSRLPTSRLLQIADRHPLFSTKICDLSRIHTISIPTIPILVHVLSRTLPNFLQEHSRGANPVRVLVVDALTQLLHPPTNSNKDTLIGRSRSIAQISALFHKLAHKYHIAILVLNETRDVFDQEMNADESNSHDMTYRDQAQWFNRAHSLLGENLKEVRLGLSWANQVNARLMASRTGRRQFVNGSSDPFRTHLNVVTDSRTLYWNADELPNLIRRLSIIFSPVGQSISSDYTVTLAGFAIVN